MNEVAAWFEFVSFHLGEDVDQETICTLTNNLISKTEKGNQACLKRLFYKISCKNTYLAYLVIEEILLKKKNDVDFQIFYYIIKDNDPSILSDKRFRNFFTYEERFLIEIFNNVAYAQKYKFVRHSDTISLSTKNDTPSESKYTIHIDDFMEVFKLLTNGKEMFIHLFSFLSTQPGNEDILIKIFQFLIDNSILLIIEFLEDEHDVMFSIRNGICYVSFNDEKEYEVDLSKTKIEIVYLIYTKTETTFTNEVFEKYIKSSILFYDDFVYYKMHRIFSEFLLSAVRDINSIHISQSLRNYAIQSMIEDEQPYIDCD